MEHDQDSKSSTTDEALETFFIDDSPDDVTIKTTPKNRTNGCYSHRKQRATPHVWFLSFFAAIGGFLIGYNTGVVSGAMLLLEDRFSLSSLQKEVVVSVTIGGGFTASLSGGILNDWFGRKPVILSTGFMFTAGAVILAVANNIRMLVVGRFVLGLGIGFTALTVPVYIAESCPFHLRGRLVTGFTLFVTGGQCVACLVNGGFSYLEQDGWRYMFGLAGIPPIVQFVGMLFFPESPRWLMSKRRPNEARKVLEKLRGTTDVDQELKEIEETLMDHERNPDRDGLTVLRMLKTPCTRRALTVGCALQFFQQFGGINVIMYYSASIVKMSGVTDYHDAIWLAALIASVNFVFTIVGIGLVERSGRKRLVIVSLLGAGPSLGICAAAFQLASVYSPSIPPGNVNSNVTCGSYTSCGSCVDDIYCGFCFTGSVGQINGTCLSTHPTEITHSEFGACANVSLSDDVNWAYNYCPTHYSWMAIFGMIVYLMFFAPGMGPMPWTINSEIYPQWARSTGNAFASTAHWLSNLTVSMTFLTMTEIITKHGTFWLFMGICFVGAIFFIIFLPETRGGTLEDVDQLFEKPWFSQRSTDVDLRKDWPSKEPMSETQKLQLEQENIPEDTCNDKLRTHCL